MIDRISELDAAMLCLAIYAAFIDGHPWFALGVVVVFGLRSSR